MPVTQARRTLELTGRQARARANLNAMNGALAAAAAAATRRFYSGAVHYLLLTYSTWGSAEALFKFINDASALGLSESSSS